MKTKERLIQFLDYKGIKPTKAENMLNWGKGAMVLKVMFVQEDNSRPYITEELNKNTLIMKFVNSNRDYSVSGIFAPIEIGKLDDGEVLYFCCSVFTINAKDGNRLFKYSFLKRI